MSDLVHSNNSVKKDQIPLCAQYTHERMWIKICGKCGALAALVSNSKYWLQNAEMLGFMGGNILRSVAYMTALVLICNHMLSYPFE